MFIMKNYGLNLQLEREHTDGTEYLGGKLPPCKAEALDKLPIDEMKKYFPKGEIQRSDVEDMMDCASRDRVNYLEAKFNYLFQNNLLTPKQTSFALAFGYYTQNGFEFSDAYVAIKAGTTKEGNSLKAGLQAVHDWGLIPKYRLPLESWMTWEDYHNPKRITDAMEDLGQKFQEVMGEIFYEKWYDYNVEKGLVTAVHAWDEPNAEGLYTRNERQFNHAVWRPRPAHFIFDNYIDKVDGDFIKQTTPDFNFFDYGYSIIIGEPKTPEKLPAWPIDLVRRLIKLFF